MSLWGNILIFTLLVISPAGWGTAAILSDHSGGNTSNPGQKKEEAQTPTIETLFNTDPLDIQAVGELLQKIDTNPDLTTEEKAELRNKLHEHIAKVSKEKIDSLIEKIKSTQFWDESNKSLYKELERLSKQLDELMELTNPSDEQKQKIHELKDTITSVKNYGANFGPVADQAYKWFWGSSTPPAKEKPSTSPANSQTGSGSSSPDEPVQKPDTITYNPSTRTRNINPLLDDPTRWWPLTPSTPSPADSPSRSALIGQNRSAQHDSEQPDNGSSVDSSSPPSESPSPSSSSASSASSTPSSSTPSSSTPSSSTPSSSTPSSSTPSSSTPSSSTPSSSTPSTPSTGGSSTPASSTGGSSTGGSSTPASSTGGSSTGGSSTPASSTGGSSAHSSGTGPGGSSIGGGSGGSSQAPTAPTDNSILPRQVIITPPPTGSQSNTSASSNTTAPGNTTSAGGPTSSSTPTPTPATNESAKSTATPKLSPDNLPTTTTDVTGNTIDATGITGGSDIQGVSSIQNGQPIDTQNLVAGDKISVDDISSGEKLTTGSISEGKTISNQPLNPIMELNATEKIKTEELPAGSPIKTGEIKEGEKLEGSVKEGGQISSKNIEEGQALRTSDLFSDKNLPTYFNPLQSAEKKLADLASKVTPLTVTRLAIGTLATAEPQWANWISPEESSSSMEGNVPSSKKIFSLAGENLTPQIAGIRLPVGKGKRGSDLGAFINSANPWPATTRSLASP